MTQIDTIKSEEEYLHVLDTLNTMYQEQNYYRRIIMGKSFDEISMSDAINQTINITKKIKITLERINLYNLCQLAA